MKGQASVFHRIIAKLIDLTLAFLLVEAFNLAGCLAAGLYLSICDGLWGGQSIGKQLLHIKTETLNSAPATVNESILRNLYIALPAALSGITETALVLLAIILIVETVVIIGNEQGRRIGDMLAATMVVYKEKQQ